MLKPYAIAHVIGLAGLAVFKWFLITVLAGVAFSGLALGQNLDLAPAQQFQTSEPIVITHGPGEKASVVKVGSSDQVPESRMIRLEDRIVVVADAGTYVVQAGTKFALFTVRQVSAAATPGEDGTVATGPEETELANVPAIPKEVGVEKPERIVWVYTRRTGCEPCTVWKESHQKAVEDDGIVVVPIYDHTKATPTFVLKRPGEKAVERVGLFPGWTDSAGILEYMSGPEA